MDIQAALPRCVCTLGMCILLQGGMASASAERTDEIARAGALWNEGKSDSAVAVITAAFGRDSSLAAVRLAYAALCVSDARRAQALYRSVSRDSAAQDSLRAEALFRLACIAEHTAGSDSTQALLLKANDAHPSTRLRRHLARAGLKAADTTVTGAKEASIDATAARRDSATLASVKKPVRGADSALAEATSVGPQKTGQKLSASGPGPDRVPADARFTLQAGAFSSAVNATRLLVELQKSFGNASIDTTTNAGAVYYKVRVGAFATEEQALDWGQQKLAPKNLTFRVITISTANEE
jgi:cell division septation protein DedD